MITVSFQSSFSWSRAENGAERALIPGVRSSERDTRKREERERSVEREIGEREWSGERKFNKLVERGAAF
jgi:hypothetical protein